MTEQAATGWRARGGSMIRDVSWTALIKAGYIVGQMAVNIVLARVMGVESFGFYALVMAYVQMLIVPVQLGFSSSLVRHIAQLASTGDGAGRAARSLLHAAVTLVVISGAVVTIGWALSGLLLAPVDLLPVGLLIVALALSGVGGASLRGLGHVVESQVAQQLVRPWAFLALLAAVIWFAQGLDPRTALSLHAAAAVLASGYALISSNAKIARMPAEGTPKAPCAVLVASLPFMLLASIQVLNYQIALAMVGFMLENSDVGIYRTAVQIADGLGVVLFAFSMALGPRIVRLQTQGDIVALKRLLLRTHLAAVAVILPLAGGVAFFAEPVITLIFGTEYVAGSVPMAILALGKIAYAGVAFSGLGLSMLGHPGRSAATLTAGLALNVALNFSLIPTFGLQGAAWATVLAAFGGNLLAAAFLAVTMRRFV